MISYFLQNVVKKSERSVPSVTNSGQYSLETFDGMYRCIKCRAGNGLLFRYFEDSKDCWRM